MKGFALVLLCVVAAAQARSASVQNAGALAAEENPWFVHLRVAVSTSGFLESCAGTLINARWVLTSASCVRNSRFIWSRYGAVDVFRPTLVTETGVPAAQPNAVSQHPTADLALIHINRDVLSPPSANISPAHVAGANVEAPASATFCGFGATEEGTPGVTRSCSEVNVSAAEDGNLAADGSSTQFDLGAGLVKDGVQYGVLVQSGEESVFLNLAPFRQWIEQTADISFPDSDEEDDGVEEVGQVIFA